MGDRLGRRGPAVDNILHPAARRVGVARPVLRRDPAAFAALAVRRMVPESALYLQSRAAVARPGLLAIFSPPYAARRCAAACSRLASRRLLRDRHLAPDLPSNGAQLSVLSTGGYLGVVIVGSFAGYLVAAYLNDYWGRRKTFLLYSIGSLTIAFSYMIIPVSNGVMLAWVSPSASSRPVSIAASARCSPSCTRRRCGGPAKVSASTLDAASPPPFRS
jgi:hypothetical protein